MTHGGDEDFAIEAVGVDHFDGVADGVHSVGSVIVDSADEVGDVGRAGFGGHKGLADGEDEGDVGADSFVGEGGDELDAVLDEGDLDDDLGAPAADFQGFFEHGVVVGGNDFGGDCAFGHQLADLEDNFFKGFSGFGDEGWVGCDSVDHAPFSGLFHFVQITGINKELHRFAVYRRFIAY